MQNKRQGMAHRFSAKPITPFETGKKPAGISHSMGSGQVFKSVLVPGQEQGGKTG
jgi:hypothetical protein